MDQEAFVRLDSSIYRIDHLILFPNYIYKKEQKPCSFIMVYLFTASFNALPALNTGAFAAA
ncbi:MAG: hypothetical protein VB095_07775, partial [Anaerovorax sp.]|nr:hypothetical protein [Anaerovorax sp.]